ncbi:unnamed protein product [Symbiodinium sp. CCMP2592]|nr:unnamed protein product [Symbiodinium sp. CCMP2592]
MLFCCCAAEEEKEASKMSEEHFKGLVQTAPAMTDPDAVPDTFTIKLLPADGKHGLQVDATNPVCTVIKDILPGGAIDNWNQNKPDLKVKKLDRIVEVNGIKGPAIDIAKALDLSDTLNIVVQRPEQRVLKLQRPGEIGMVLNYKKIGSAAPWISKITPGLLTKWNQEMPDQAVQLHDRIVAVNGAQGRPEEMLCRGGKRILPALRTLLHGSIARNFLVTCLYLDRA